MKTGALGLVVAGGGGPLDELGIAGDAALTPFAGSYRFVDFALATLINSEVPRIWVAASGSGMLAGHLARAARGVKALRRPFPVPLAGPPGRAGRRASRVVRALHGARPLFERHRPEAVVVLTADHILQLDARRVLDAHRASGADVTVCALPLPAEDAPGRAALDRDGDRVVGAATASATGIELTWTGDLVVTGGALDAVFATLPADVGGDDADLVDGLAGALGVIAYDVGVNRVPGACERRGAFWHDPTTLEAYYDAQMNLCTPRPALDLYNAAWPVLPVATGLGPAKVVADEAGRAGQALNSLVSDGAVIRGGVVVNTVLGRGVVVESGAEVEDSVLLDGCRVGRGARVRRAVVGAAPARVVRSGLTVVPAR